jgi:spore coat protein A, manganese oxidase
MVTRRQFLKASAASGVGLLLPWKGGSARVAAVRTPSSSPGAATAPTLTRWVDQLPIPPVLKPNTTAYPGADYYEISMEQKDWQFHNELAARASWGYWSGSIGIGYLGPTIVAQKGRPVVVKYTNNLPSTHLLSNAIDTTLHSMEGLSSEARAVPHLHGGFTAPQFDGHPDSWFAPNGAHGMKYATLKGTAKNAAIFQYSNEQPACMLWYHDHAMGITRLNAYAGLAAAYIIRDSLDTGLPDNPLGLPAGAYEVPVVIQDKMFNADGSMRYTTDSDQDDESYPHPIWVPEFFGDTPVVNGKAYPYLKVEPRRYRLRLLNGSQARFYDLRFDNAGTAVPFNLIGMEQSLLPNKSVQRTRLVLAPAERADIIIDFANVPFGTTLTLVNGANEPYPDGENPVLTKIMQFRVKVQLKSKDTTTPPGRLVLPAIARLTATARAPMREIVMRETMDETGENPIHVRLNGKWFTDTPIDETPKAGTTEIWQFINLTVDAHPMHMHLVKFQVYDRQPFDADAYTTAWDAWKEGRGTKPVLAKYFTGAPVAPPREEMGWKDTVKALPGQITRIIATFDVPPGSKVNKVHGGYDYVYHCHILEHEENEMMRPFVVQP